ncbi:protein of unknown function [Paraburkholderia dioscoreae]|uniref:Uncharacterized protein n=1 Tax=Paraburkholderia dioscoreae TaxID=2604047 RepID=A0A5Q4Z749_9BURK|nr:protein of unknown function [Paraburkholderia dioscoreae]
MAATGGAIFGVEGMFIHQLVAMDRRLKHCFTQSK